MLWGMIRELLSQYTAIGHSAVFKLWSSFYVKHTCQPLKFISWTLGFQEFSGIGGALSYGATSTRLRHLYKHDIVHMYIHVVQCSLSRCHTAASRSRRCEGVATRDCKINSTSTRIYTHTRTILLCVRFCPVPGPCVGRKTTKTPGCVCTWLLGTRAR